VRQIARYLRNALMAKLGGEQTELLQISADERARAVRTALLFTEEELTRNLQIVLRTFDDLNYRQEQRFHLELGLLKLIHAQRLLPIEELLSGAASGVTARGAVAGSPPKTNVRAQQPIAGLSPSMNAGPSRTAIGFGSVAEVAQSTTVLHTPGFDNPAATHASAVIGQTKPLAESDVAAQETHAPAASTNGAGLEHVREAIVGALTTAGHNSAALLLGSGRWKLEGATLRIEVPGIKKKMLELTVSAAAEKIIRQELQRLGAAARFMVTPGEGTVTASAAAPVVAGSVQEAALAHPLVRRAQEIFKAEVRSVVDLRQK
jgi:DNA polymerase III subunit gamma/tau